MPNVFGRSRIHISEVSTVIENHVPLIEGGGFQHSPAGHAIGELVAPMVPDGATIQIGIGSVAYGGKRRCHIIRFGHPHRIVFARTRGSINKGVITGARKTLHPHKHVFTMAIGTRDTYELMNNNVAFESYPSSYVNDIRIIAANDNLISINTALQLDLHGQVNAEVIGEEQFQRIRRAVRLCHGASPSRGGKSIIALQSTTKNGTFRPSFRVFRL